MTIVDRIEQAELDLLKLTGKDPKVVYLGTKEVNDLRLALSTQSSVQIVRHRVQGRLQVLGLLVYVVNEMNYLKVGL